MAKPSNPSLSPNNNNDISPAAASSSANQSITNTNPMSSTNFSSQQQTPAVPIWRQRIQIQVDARNRKNQGLVPLMANYEKLQRQAWESVEKMQNTESKLQSKLASMQETLMSKMENFENNKAADKLQQELQMKDSELDAVRNLLHDHENDLALKEQSLGVLDKRSKALLQENQELRSQMDFFSRNLHSNSEIEQLRSQLEAVGNLNFVDTNHFSKTAGGGGSNASNKASSRRGDRIDSNFSNQGSVKNQFQNNQNNQMNVSNQGTAMENSHTNVNSSMQQQTSSSSNTNPNANSGMMQNNQNISSINESQSSTTSQNPSTEMSINSPNGPQIKPPTKIKRQKRVHDADLTAISCVVNPEFNPMALMAVGAADGVVKLLNGESGSLCGELNSAAVAQYISRHPNQQSQMNSQMNQPGAVPLEQQFGSSVPVLSSPVSALAVSLDSLLVLAAFNDGSWRCYETPLKKNAPATLRCEGRRAHGGKIASCGFFSSNSCKGFTAGLDRSIKIWDFSHPTTFLKGVSNSSSSPSAAGSANAARHFIKTIPTPGPITAVCSSPVNETLLCSAHSSGQINIWNSGTGDFICEYERHNGFVNGISFSPDGRFVVSQGREDSTVRVFHADTMRVMHSLNHPDFRSPEHASTPLFDGYSRYILACSVNGLFCWDLKSGNDSNSLKLVFTAWPGPNSAQNQIMNVPTAVNWHLPFVMSCHADGVLKLWGD